MQGTSFQADNITLRNLQVQRPLVANYQLFTDGQGGTQWSTLSSVTATSYSRIETDNVIYPALLINNTFAIKSGPGIGQVESDPQSNAQVTLFAKAMQGIKVVGGDSVRAFTNDFLNPVMNFSTTRGIDIIAQPQGNTIKFTLSTLSNDNNLVLGSTLASTVAGLGTAGYLSSIYTSPEFVTLSTSVSLAASTISTILVPTVESILVSTLDGMGTFGYFSDVSTYFQVSSAASISPSTVKTQIEQIVIPSTITGLGTFGQFSDIQTYFNVSTATSIGLSTVFTVLSTTQAIFELSTFPSTIDGLGTLGYTSTLTDQNNIFVSSVSYSDQENQLRNMTQTSSQRFYFNSSIIGPTVVQPIQFIVF